MKDSYVQKVVAFNRAAGSSYAPSLRFLTFRRTRKGIKVGYTLAKSYEIYNLRHYVNRAGEPYYMG